MKMICKVCPAQKGKIEMMRSYNSTFISGSTNYKVSTLKDHVQAECHKRAVKEKTMKYMLEHQVSHYLCEKCSNNTRRFGNEEMCQENDSKCA